MVAARWQCRGPCDYTSSTQRLSLNKCASEKRNIEEVRHKIKVSNHNATRLVRFWQKTQSGPLFTIRCYGDLSELPNRNWKINRTGDYFVMTCSPLTPQPPVTIETARPYISTGNIGKWLSEIFFGWKNYRKALFLNLNFSSQKRISVLLTWLDVPCSKPYTARKFLGYSRESKSRTSGIVVRHYNNHYTTEALLIVIIVIVIIIIFIIIKAKGTPLQTMKAHGGCECKGPHIHSHGTRRRKGG